MVFIAFSICWSSRVPELCAATGCWDDLLESYSSKAMPHKSFASVGYGHAHHIPDWLTLLFEKNYKRWQAENFKPLQATVLTIATRFEDHPKYLFRVIE